MAWLVLGRRSPAGFGIHSKFSALVANNKAAHLEGCLRGGEPAGDPKGFVESCASISAHPCPLHTDPRPTCRESQRPCLLWGSYVSNTIATHMRQEPKPPHAHTHRPTRGDTQQHGGTQGRWRLLWLAGGWWAGRWGPVIALGGSSNPALCTSHTGAGGAPCSGRTRPGHRASPGVSACAGTR